VYASCIATYPDTVPLPGRLYKFLEARWADSLINEGVVHCSSLAWFQNFEDDEDDERSDPFEGKRKYFPIGGLPIQKLGAPSPGLLPDQSFQSAVLECNHIFVFSTSLEAAPDVADRFRRPTDREMVSVEIKDPVAFAARFRATLGRLSRVQQRTFFSSLVSYYRFEEPPLGTWALPHRIVMHKEKRFEHQCEYRFAFATRRHAFDANAVDTVLVGKDHRRPRPALDPAQHCRNIRLGSLADVCRLVR